MTNKTTIEVTLTQEGNGIYSREFPTIDQAKSFAQNEWDMNRNDPDFVRGRDERAEWKVWVGEKLVWRKQANEEVV